ncbi:hypothetical protein RRF57_002177 [Xylaria bambusicola]|uniref:Uncharacterized protein n=1 Tax=Xylaria bambusicola TaxID=326684 RepID=A0AAN7Z1K5_9PEZI
MVYRLAKTQHDKGRFVTQPASAWLHQMALYLQSGRPCQEVEDIPEHRNDAPEKLRITSKYGSMGPASSVS